MTTENVLQPNKCRCGFTCGAEPPSDWHCSYGVVEPPKSDSLLDQLAYNRIAQPSQLADCLWDPTRFFVWLLCPICLDEAVAEQEEMDELDR